MTISPRKPAILFLDKINLAYEQFEQLSQEADIVYLTACDRAGFLSDLKRGEYGDVVGIYRHFKAGQSTTITGRIDEEIVRALPSSVRFIAHNGAGYDQIDIAACSSRSIQVANVSSVVDAPTADTAIFLILSCLRQFPAALQAGHQGEFNSRLPLTNDPKDKVLGILGLGGIGKALAARALAFDMRVQYHNRTRLSSSTECALGVVYVDSMDELLKNSDVVSLNLPLNASTKHGP